MSKQSKRIDDLDPPEQHAKFFARAKRATDGLPLGFSKAYAEFKAKHGSEKPASIRDEMQEAWDKGGAAADKLIKSGSGIIKGDIIRVGVTGIGKRELDGKLVKTGRGVIKGGVIKGEVISVRITGTGESGLLVGSPIYIYGKKDDSVQIIEEPKRRGKQIAPTKTLISIRVDSTAVAAFRNTGKGWQSRVNDTLVEAAQHLQDQSTGVMVSPAARESKSPTRRRAKR